MQNAPPQVFCCPVHYKWPTLETSIIFTIKKMPCNHTVWSIYSGMWAYWCRKSYSLEDPSIQIQNIKNDHNWEFSCHAPAAMRHPTVYIYSGILSIFRPAFFKPPRAELQILDHQARLPDKLILSNLGDKSRLQNSSPHVRRCRKSRPKSYMIPITLPLDFHWEEPKVFFLWKLGHRNAFLLLQI